MRVRVRRHREVALADRLADPRPRLTPQVLELPLIDPYEGLGYSDVVRLATTCGILAFGCVVLGAACSGEEESQGVVVAAENLPSIVAVRPM